MKMGTPYLKWRWAKCTAQKELDEIEHMMKDLEKAEVGDGPDGFGTLLDDFVLAASTVRPLPC
jgi:hypothetical protein